MIRRELTLLARWNAFTGHMVHGDARGITHRRVRGRLLSFRRDNCPCGQGSIMLAACTPSAERLVQRSRARGHVRKVRAGLGCLLWPPTLALAAALPSRTHPPRSDRRRPPPRRCPWVGDAERRQRSPWSALPHPQSRSGFP